MKLRIERPLAYQQPQRMHVRIVGVAGVQRHLLQLALHRWLELLVENSLRGPSPPDVGTGKKLEQRFGRILLQIERLWMSGIAIGDPIDPAALAIDALRIALRILIAVIPIV